MTVRKAELQFEKDCILLSGELDLHNIMQIYKESLVELNRRSVWHFDFSHLRKSDSSGLALIIEWIKLANQQNKKVVISNLSDELQNVAKAASLQDFLNMRKS